MNDSSRQARSTESWYVHQLYKSLLQKGEIKATLCKSMQTAKIRYTGDNGAGRARKCNG